MTTSIRFTVALLVGVGGLLALAIAAMPSRQLEQADSVSQLVAVPGEESVVAYERIKAKDKVTDRLLANELSLLEAASWFRYLNDNPTKYPSDFRKFWNGASDGEKSCRQVIAWARTRLLTRMPPSQADLAVAPLDAELRRLLCDNEVIELPW